MVKRIAVEHDDPRLTRLRMNIANAARSGDDEREAAARREYALARGRALIAAGEKLLADAAEDRP